MYKVFLIDDERPIIEGLKVLIDWEGLGFKIVGEASDGEEAVKKIMEAKPHLILTDIEMPGMDGLEMIKQLKNQLPEVKVLVLSGYNYFEYAKRSMEHGTLGYLLKPVDENELKEYLYKVKTYFNKEQQIKNNSEKLNDQMKNSFLLELTSKKIDNESTVLKRLRHFGINKNFERFNIAIIEMDDRVFVDNDEIEANNRVVDSAKDVLAHELCNVNNGEFFEISPNRFGLIFDYDESNDMSNNEIVILLRDIKKHIQSTTGETITIGLGKQGCGCKEMFACFNQASEALRYKLIYGKNRIIEIEKIDIAKYSNTLFISEQEETIMQVIECCEKEKVQISVEKVFRQLLEGHLAPDAIKKFWLGVIVAMSKYISELNGNVDEIFDEDILSLQVINKYKTINALKEWLIGIFLEAIDYIINLNKARTVNVIEDIKHYIDKHYADEISMETISAKFYINKYYFSQLFKKKMGENFHDYLTSVRIKNAKRLLKNKNIKVYEVASLVGYSNARYFGQLFRRNLGMTPSEYRDMD